MSETHSDGACFHLVWKISRYATGCLGCGALPIAPEGSPVGRRWWIRPLTPLIVVPAAVAAAPTIDIPTIEDLRSAIAKVGVRLVPLLLAVGGLAVLVMGGLVVARRCRGMLVQPGA